MLGVPQQLPRDAREPGGTGEFASHPHRWCAQDREQWTPMTKQHAHEDGDEANVDASKQTVIEEREENIQREGKREVGGDGDVNPEANPGATQDSEQQSQDESGSWGVLSEREKKRREGDPPRTTPVVRRAGDGVEQRAQRQQAKLIQPPTVWPWRRGACFIKRCGHCATRRTKARAGKEGPSEMSPDFLLKRASRPRSQCFFSSLLPFDF